MLVLMVSTQVCGTCSMSSNLVHHPNLGVAQSGSASGLGPEGREFESLHRDQIFFQKSAFYGVHSLCSVVEYTIMKNCRVSINAVKPVNDIKFKTQVGRKAIPQEKPSPINNEERHYANT